MAGDATYTFTADPSTNTITSVAHGQSNKDLIGIKLDSGTLPEPLLIETPYYIRNATADTFQLCLTTNIDDPIVDVTTIGLGVYSFFESSSYSERTADLRAYMIGNVIYNTQNDHDKAYGNTSSYKPNQGVGFEKALYKRYIVDNTIFDVGGGINIGNQFPYDETVMSGDVIAGVYGVDDSGDKDFHITMTATGGTDNTFLNYSFFQPRADDGTVNFKWAGAEPSSSIGSLEALQSSSVGQCQNCWTGDPMFVDPAAYDLHPKAGSPLIGKNVRHAVYDEFEARYGLSIDVDFDGNPRPPTAAEGRTIGAYEFDTGYIPPDPECDQYHPSLCLDQTSCTGAGLNWCDEACQVSECGAEPTCADLTQNGDETGIDCGGSCPPCETPMQTARWLRLAAGPVKIVDQPE
jgi:hypothetical protein